MAKFTGTDLPQLSNGSDDVAVKKSILDLLAKINIVADAQYPVGYVYTQYPGQTDPATLFGGTWLNITSLYAGSFFRAEGGASLAFNAGVQSDAFQGHWHGIPTYGIALAGGDKIPQSNGGGAAGSIATGAVTDGTNGTPRIASETRPVNQSIRIWQKSGNSGAATVGTSVTINAGIYDSGSNGNGSWIRYTDGTMMCWGKQTIATLPSTINNNIGTYGWSFFEGTLNVTLPQNFVDTTYAWHGLIGDTTNNSGFSRLQSRSISGGQIVLDAAANVSTFVDWISIGKWSNVPVTSPAFPAPTSGIYDSGTNSNGSWIRFTDGTMQCWGNVTQTNAITGVYGTGLFFYNNTSWQTFPVAFTVIPSTNITTDSSVWCTPRGTSATTIGISALAGSSETSSHTYYWSAIGKWK
jgi:hypothetical protein